MDQDPTVDSTAAPAASSSSEANPSAGRLGLVALILAIMALAQYLTVLGVFGPRLQEHFDMSNRQLGTLFGCSTLGALVALPFVGLAVNRLGAHRTAQWSTVGVGVGLVLCGLGHSLVLFEAGVLTVGAFASGLSVAATALLVSLYPASKRRVLSVTMAAYSAPGIVLPLLAEYLLALAPAGDRVAFAFVLHGSCGVVGLLLIVGAGLLRLSRASGQGKDDYERRTLDLRRLLLWPTPLILLLAALHGASDQTLYQWLPKFMTGRFAELPIAPGLVLSLAAVAYVVGRSLQAALPEGVGQRAFLVLPGVLGGLTILGALWWGNALAVGLLYPLAALLWCLEYPALVSEVDTASSSHFSTVLAAANLVQYFLGVVSTNAVGWIVDRTGSLQVGLTPAALGFVVFGVVAALAGLGQRPAGLAVATANRRQGIP
ncbi:MAG: sugar MFS transporter [Armatimonadota bacterium]